MKPPKEQQIELLSPDIQVSVSQFINPLLEVKMHKGLILTSDQSFIQKLLEGYQNAAFLIHSMLWSSLIKY